MMDEKERPAIPQTTRPLTTVEKGWTDRFWDLNKQLGVATADESNIDRDTAKRLIKEADTLAEEILSAGASDVPASLAVDASLTLDYARESAVDAPPSLKKLAERAPKESPDT